MREGYRVRGVECQVGHSMVSDVEERIAPVLDGREPARRIRAANFSDQLAKAMVEHHLHQIFALWYIAAGLENRDAGLWVRSQQAR